MHLMPLTDQPCARLVIAATWRPNMGLEEVIEKLSSQFGAVLRWGEVYDFSALYSPYYENEMGMGLLKCFIEFSGIRDRSTLLTAKLSALAFEQENQVSGKRVINVDPMLVSLENVLISTTKNAPQRVFIGQGIFADLALIRKDGAYRPFEWTYRDYVDHCGFFEESNKGLKKELRERAS